MKLTKTELSARVKEANAGEVFEHSELGWFNISEMREMLRYFPEWICQVDIKALLPQVGGSNVWAEERVKSLTDEECEEPGIVIVDFDGTHVLADGIHRLIRRERNGEQIMRFYFCPVEHAIRLDPVIVALHTALLGSSLAPDWGISMDDSEGLAEQLKRLQSGQL